MGIGKRAGIQPSQEIGRSKYKFIYLCLGLAKFFLHILINCNGVSVISFGKVWNNSFTRAILFQQVAKMASAKL